MLPLARSQVFGPPVTSGDRLMPVTCHFVPHRPLNSLFFHRRTMGGDGEAAVAIDVELVLLTRDDELIISV